MTIRAAVCLSLVLPALSGLYTLQDLGRPGVWTDGQSLAWWEGGPAFLLASSGAVRVNFRGLYTYPPSAIVRDLDPGLGWHGVKCNASAWALCASDVGQVMPWSRPRMPERQESVSADGWKDLGCSNSDGKVLVSAGVYDISACDVFDERLDLLYTPGKVYHRHNTLQLWKYWTLVFLAIVLVRFLSYNVQALWDTEGHEAHSQWPALACSLAVVVLVVLDGDSLLVTSADQVFFWATVGYILVYLAIHASRRFWACHDDYEVPVYNVIVASLQLVASRFYAAAETPYNLVLIGILACRAW